MTCQLKPEESIVVNWVKRKSKRVSVLARSHGVCRGPCKWELGVSGKPVANEVNAGGLAQGEAAEVVVGQAFRALWVTFMDLNFICSKAVQNWEHF